MYEDLKEKVALITGSGKRTGIGFAVAEELAKNGAWIVIADLGDQGAGDPEVAIGSVHEMNEIADSLASSYGVKTLAVSVDVTDNASIAAMANRIRETFGHLDILCNNAGASFGVPNTFHTYEEDAWMKTIDVNLHSVFRVTRGLLPLMTGRNASIINTASRAGKVAPLFNGAYGVAKAGVIMLTKIMALELAAMGFRVNAICPGQIMTDLEKWRFGLEANFFGSTVEEREAEMCKTIPLNRIGSPKEVGTLVAFLASEAASYLTGQAINITGGQLMEL
jgi:NAD(P)-dependent dehydrogenase (short-subunit alcohol dehydrogenase family)